MKQGEITFKEVNSYIPEWESVRKGGMTAQDIRERYICSHGIVLQALGRVGHCVFGQDKESYRLLLQNLTSIDWSLKNRDWEGRAILGGRITKSPLNVILTANYIKKICGISLVYSEEEIERSLYGI